MGCKLVKPRENKASVFFDGYVKTLTSQVGKNVVITGCTSGTGFILAKTSAQLGANVYMLNRKSERADAALNQLEEAFPGRVTNVECDLQSFESVRKAGAELCNMLGDTGLDILCNNAGVMALAESATVDGYDVQMQTNHLSHFLLTAEVMPLLQVAATQRGEARVVNHTSMARKGKRTNVKHFQSGQDLGGDSVGLVSGPRWDRYQQSKLANIMFTYALHDKIAGTNIKSLAAHPGVANTNLFVTTAQNKGIGGTSGVLMMRMSQSAEDGTLGILACCYDPSAESCDLWGPRGMTGAAVKMPAAPEIKRCPPAERDMLWEYSVKATGAKFA